MRLVKATVRDFKRIELAEIEIEDGRTEVKIAGRNAQGKSSFLDGIATSLEGAATGVDRPVRSGADGSETRLHLRGTGDEPDLVVTKRWGKSGAPRLIVERSDGSILRKPQEVLRGVFAPIALDPGRLAAMTGKQRRAALLEMTGLGSELDRMNEAEAGFRTKRQDVGREKRDAEGALAQLEDLGDTLEEVVPVARVVEEYERAKELDSAIREDARTLESLQALREAKEKELEEIRSRIQETEERVTTHGSPPDLDAHRKAVDEAESKNEEIRSRNRIREERAAVSKKVEALSARYAAMTEEIEKIEDSRREALQSAKWPIPGLSVADDDIAFNGSPLGSCSQSERIRIAAALAFASSPKLPVVLVRDASLFDDETRQVFIDAAREANPDAVVILECVGEDVEGAWVIEEGKIVRTPTVAKKEDGNRD